MRDEFEKYRGVVRRPSLMRTPRRSVFALGVCASDPCSVPQTDAATVDGLLARGEARLAEYRHPDKYTGAPRPQSAAHHQDAKWPRLLHA